MRVAPDCRRIGAFTVRGHAGVNRVVFRGRVRGRALPLGTYRVTGRAGRRRLVAVTILVAAHRPTPRALAAARAANACAAVLVSAPPPVEARGPVGGPPTASSAPGKSSSSRSAPAASVPPVGDVLGAQFSKTASGVDPTHFMLLAAAALAILLLGLAAVPPTALADARLATLVEERRTELALAGAMTLLAAVLVYLAGGG